MQSAAAVVPPVLYLNAFFFFFSRKAEFASEPEAFLTACRI